MSVTRCLSCGVEPLERDHLEWCPNRLRRRDDDDNSSPISAPGAVVTRLDQVQLERVDWLWPGRLPLRKLGVFDGDPGTGKSTVAIDIAARVTTGSPMPDGAALDGPTNVVVMTAEDGLGDTVRPRVEAAAGDPASVYTLEAIRESDGNERPPRIPDDLAVLGDLVQGVGAKLVIVDVLAAYLSGAVDSYRDADVRRALHPLARLAEETGAVVLVLRHLSKSGGTNAIYRGGGSIGIIGAARVGLLAAPEPEDEGRRVLAVTKSNLAAIPPALAYRLVPDERHGCARVDWLGATAHQASDLLRVEDAEDRSARDEAVEFLLDFLDSEGGSASAKDVKRAARDAGIAERTLDRARQRADVETRREGFGPGKHWAWSIRSRPDGSRSRHRRHPSEVGENGENDSPDGENEHADPQQSFDSEQLLSERLGAQRVDSYDRR